MGYLQMTRNVESIFGAVVTAPHQIPYTYTATGGETFISLPFYPVTGFITINSGVQVPVDNYVIDGNTVNLGRALEAGDVVYCLFDKILSPEDYQNGIRIYKFQAVGNETSFTPDFTAYGVQSLYVDGKFQIPGVNYSYSPTTGVVTFLGGSPASGVWVVAEMSIKQNYPALSQPGGAGMIGSNNGKTVQQNLTTDRNNIREAIKRELANEGFALVDGSFEEGGTVTLATDALWHQEGHQCYVYTGTLPKTVAQNSSPVGDSNWIVASGNVAFVGLSKHGIYVESLRKTGLTDDQVIAQADAVAATIQSRLIFQAGKTYTVTTVSPSVCWVGNNATLKRKDATGSPMIVMKSNSRLTGFKIDGSKATASSVVPTVYFNNVHGAQVDHCEVINAGEHGISLVNDTTVANRTPNKVLDNIVHGAFGSGIYMYDSLYAKIKGNEVYACSGGILAQGSHRTYVGADVIDNDVHDNTGGGIAFALMTEAEDQQAYEKIKILSNRVYGNGNNGIAVQADLALVCNNHVWANGSQTYHQGILVNANAVVVNANSVTDNGGVGVDLGDCRKCSVTANHIEGNGWIGIEVNSCEQTTVASNILNLNFKGKADGDLQAAILVHKGSGGYPFLGDCKDVTVVGNSISSGDGQRFAILVAGPDCYDVVITGNTCKLAGLADDIVSRSPDVVAQNNYTRWSALGTARGSIASNIASIPSVADTVTVNGTGSVISVNLTDGGAFIKDRTVRIIAQSGFTLENSGGTSGNLFLGSSVVLPAGGSIKLYSDGSGGWTKAI